MAEITWKDYKNKKNTKPMPLQGVRMLEVATLILGPVGTSYAASMGAEVIKCEIPPVGDTSRNMTPFGYFYKGFPPVFIHNNVNKYWIGLDLHKPEAQEVFLELAAKSDVVEINLRPGVMEKWNVGYHHLKAVNPGIIYISKTGFGQWGAYATENRPSNDGASQGLCGYAWMSSFPGRPPLKSCIYPCDDYGGLMGEVAVLAALHHRKKTGKGQFIDLSQSENIMRLMSWVWPYQQLTGKTAMPAGNRDVSICPADTVYTADEKFVALAAPAPEEFKGLCTAMGKPELTDDPRFNDHLTRLKDENAVDILAIVAEWARTKSAAEIEALAEKHGFAATRVKSIKDLIENNHSQARGYITEIDDPVLGNYRDYDFPVMMSKTPPRVKWTVRPVGFDNEFVMTKHLGKNQEQIKALYDCGAIGKWGDLPGRQPPADWDGKSGLIMSRDAEEKE